MHVLCVEKASVEKEHLLDTKLYIGNRAFFIHSLVKGKPKGIECKSMLISPVNMKTSGHLKITEQGKGVHHFEKCIISPGLPPWIKVPS